LSKKPAKQQYGRKRLPLFESIPMDRVIIDTLHLFLRTVDLLIYLLIMDLQRESWTNSISPNKHIWQHMNNFSMTAVGYPLVGILKIQN